MAAGNQGVLARIKRRYLSLDLTLLLPALARLPQGLANASSRWRGALAYHAGLDWRSLAVGEPFVRDRSLQALRHLSQAQGGLWSEHTVVALLKRRFVVAAQEELDAARIIQAPRAGFAVRYEGQAACEAGQGAEARGTIWLGCHVDALFVGVQALGLAGRAELLMSSNTVEHPQVPLAAQRHFQRKYAALSLALGPRGAVLHKETHLRTMTKRLAAGAGLVVVGDIPAAHPTRAFAVPWFGQELGLDDGVYRLAARTDARIQAFACWHAPSPPSAQVPSTHCLVFGPTADPRMPNYRAQLRALYAWHGQAIAQDPSRWWALDLLPLAPVLLAQASNGASMVV
jgi:lauroyl/myristoyl acyltransferase